MPKHISAGKAMLFWGISILLIIIGFFTAISYTNRISNFPTGFGIMIFGIILAVVNKLVFKTRTKQLEIDTREVIRDRMSSPRDVTLPAQYCQKCGYRLKSRC